MVNDFQFILDGMTWSFSRINSFSDCHYGWLLHYIECAEAQGGFFSDFGSYIHSILKKYLSGELEAFQLSSYYEDHYQDAIHYDPPPNPYTDLGADYYEKGLAYFDNFDWDRDEMGILGVEMRVKSTLPVMGREVPFIGYVDLLERDGDGGLVITDHKSSSIRFLNNGEAVAKDRSHFLAFKRQLYLYSKCIFEKYGEFPKTLRWNLFKMQEWKEIPFNQNEYEEALQWATDTIETIYAEDSWEPNTSNSFYCSELCSVRFECHYQNVGIGDGSDDYRQEQTP